MNTESLHVIVHLLSGGYNLPMLMAKQGMVSQKIELRSNCLRTNNSTIHGSLGQLDELTSEEHSSDVYQNRSLPLRPIH